MLARPKPEFNSSGSTTESPHWQIVGNAVRLAFLLAIVRGFSAGKDIFVAQRFGAGEQMDAFLIALSIPNYLTTVLIGSLASVFVPRYVKAQERQGCDAANRLLGSALIGGVTIFTLVAVILAAISPVLIRLLGSNFEPEKLALTQTLLFVLLAAFVVNTASGLIGAALNCSNRFLLSGIAPIAVPCCVLVAVWTSSGNRAIYAMTVGVLAGSTLELAIVVTAARRHSLLSGCWDTVDRPAAKALAMDALPLILSSGLLASSLVIDQAMASAAEPGGPSILSYGGKLVALILAILVASLTTVVFPSFSRMVSQERWQELRATLTTILKLTVVITVPLTLALALANEWLIRVLFERGRFTAETTAAVAPVQLAFLLQIPFYTAGVVGVRLLNAMGGNRTVLAIAGAGLVVNIVGNVVLMRFFGAAGIAASTSLAYVGTSTLILMTVYRRLGRAVPPSTLPAPHFNLRKSSAKNTSG